MSHYRHTQFGTLSASLHGWLYNISGFAAVEFEFADGKKVRIGTNEPRELLREVRRAASLD